MYKSTFGTKQQITFPSEDGYYQFLGYLSKSNGSTELVWEDNDLQGAWAKEGRIIFHEKQPTALKASLSHTAGVGNIASRVNCNEFIDHIQKYHGFVLGKTQDIHRIGQTVPQQYFSGFDAGLKI